MKLKTLPSQTSNWRCPLGAPTKAFLTNKRDSPLTLFNALQLGQSLRVFLNEKKRKQIEERYGQPRSLFFRKVSVFQKSPHLSNRLVREEIFQLLIDRFSAVLPRLIYCTRKGRRSNLLREQKFGKKTKQCLIRHVRKFG